MKKIFYFLFSVFLFSCGNNKQESTETKQIKPLLSVVKKHNSAESVHLVYAKEVENWQELKAVDSFLKKFEKASPNEVLSNALELRDLVKNLKDSIIPEIFNIPSFNARIHVLNNETLRLADLTYIPAIEPAEINNQVDKTIAAFSAVNSKINTILSKKRFEEAIDINLDFIGIDSTKIDSISKKSIDNNRKEELLRKMEIKEEIPIKKQLLKPIKRKNLKEKKQK